MEKPSEGPKAESMTTSNLGDKSMSKAKLKDKKRQGKNKRRGQNSVGEDSQESKGLSLLKRARREHPNPQIGVLVVSIKVGKPRKDDWFRIRSGQAWQFPTYLAYDKTTEQQYILPEDLLEHAFLELVEAVTLVLGVTEQGTPFLWPLKESRSGLGVKWANSRWEMVHLASGQWIRIEADRSTSGYNYYYAQGADFGDPKWPAGTMEELVERAFSGRIIADRDHELLKRFRGEL